MRRISISLFLFLLAPAAARASCGSESCPLDHAGRWGSTPLTFEISYQYVDQDQPRVGRDDAAPGAIPRHHDELRTVNRVTTARATYRFAEAWSFGAAFPFIDRYHAHIHHHGGEDLLERWDYSGPGDLEMVLLRSFGGGESGRRFYLTTGVKAPTGDTNVADEAGDQPEPAARPGSGSWDFLAGVGTEWLLGFPGSDDPDRTIPIRMSVTGRLNGRGTEEYRIGPEVQAHLTGEYPLGDRVAILGQANVRVRGKDDVGSSGEEEDDTGGTMVFLSPGLRLAVGPRASVYGLVQLPAYQRVNGIQIVSEMNLYLGVTGGF